jgi:hypothetical protein
MVLLMSRSPYDKYKRIYEYAKLETNIGHTFVLIYTHIYEMMHMYFDTLISIYKYT